MCASFMYMYYVTSEHIQQPGTLQTGKVAHGLYTLSYTCTVDILLSKI